MTSPLALPLSFRPVYHELMWGGRRMAALRSGVPAGQIGESWDLADHPRGMSVVAAGDLAGSTLDAVVRAHGRDLIGETWDGGAFPLLVKLIDAEQRLSLQVHPDDALARSLGVGDRGKTECWLMVADGGELFVGTKPGVDRAALERGLADGSVESLIERFATRDGDFFFLPARTVHAIGAGCLLYEVQQTCDVTFRVSDWGRVGLDGKPRQLHVAESLATIDTAARLPQPIAAPEVAHPDGGTIRHLVDCRYFSVEERRGRSLRGGGNGRCSVITCLGGSGTVATAAGAIPLPAMSTVLIPACAGPWQVQATVPTGTAMGDQLGVRLMVAVPG